MTYRDVHQKCQDKEPNKGNNQEGLIIYSVQGIWVTQSVKCPTSAQVMISWLVSSSSVSGSVLTAPSLEPASDSVSLSLCPSHVRALSLSLSVSQ